MEKNNGINCYTINTRGHLEIHPGIPVEFFDFEVPSIRKIVLKESPVCRYAVEERFKKYDPTSLFNWIVDSGNVKSYYRYHPQNFGYTNSYNVKADVNLIILIRFDNPDSIPEPCFFENALLLTEHEALIHRCTSDFTLMGKEVKFTSNRLTIE